MADRKVDHSDRRPDPDALLARVAAEEAKARRGTLKIFFGYAAGVGKTYAMLEAARREKAAGVDVVIGYIEPHGRIETERLAEGIESIPVRKLQYRGAELREFDLDAALARRPALVLVDELAHTNAEGSRHLKRWQDVEELLEAGIDVYSTLNVQHIESLNDVIAQITGVTVRETLPDAVIERADEIELIDITAEELMERLAEGKVYLPSQAERALRNFFQKANLVALRELALRKAASRLHQDVEIARRDRVARVPWPTTERLLVCIGPSPTTPKVIRSAKRMAAAFDAPWLAAAVETTDAAHTPPADRERISRHLRLAQELGAETHTLVGRSVSEAILEFARERNVAKLVVGKTLEPWWRRPFRGSVVDEILEGSGDIDVYVVQGEAEAEAAVAAAPLRSSTPVLSYVKTAGAVALATLVSWPFHSMHAAEANIVMIYLLGVVFVAMRYGLQPSAAAAVASVMVFDFCFVPPRFTFAVSDIQYVATFAVMLAVGLLVSSLASRLQQQVGAAQYREKRTRSLYQLSRQLSEGSGVDFLAAMAGRQMEEMFDGEVVLYLRDEKGELEVRFGGHATIAHNEINRVVARWAYDHGRVAGAGTDTLPNATAYFAPLIGSQRSIGAVGVAPRDPDALRDPEQRRLLDACAGQIALAVERDWIVLEAQESQVRARAEQLRASLLSSVSHDLRTPLAVIAGAASSLLDGQNVSDAATRRELIETIVEEAHHLSRLVDNLLDMTRLESGVAPIQPQWHVLEELIGSALNRVKRQLAGHRVVVRIPENLPMVSVDGVLFEQVFVNLLENAARYTPRGSRVLIEAWAEPADVMVKVQDDGPGFPAGAETKIFEKFFRAGNKSADGERGVGLGLAICKSIVEAHGGAILARHRPEGGAEFLIRIPARERLDAAELEAALAREG